MSQVLSMGVLDGHLVSISLESGKFVGKVDGINGSVRFSTEGEVIACLQGMIDSTRKDDAWEFSAESAKEIRAYALGFQKAHQCSSRSEPQAEPAPVHERHRYPKRYKCGKCGKKYSQYPAYESHLTTCVKGMEGE